ncbi:MAG TPA: N-acetylmuramoyl-L-alanine amidase [Deinococcales bacterium]|nr:N-acetylmuramoyl-L-alanine amidase [Deinococcales bacterium]
MNLRLLTILLLFLSAFALGQERLNSLAVDGVLSDEAGPYYFGDAGNDTVPYARAGALADTLGLNLNWNGENRTLSFRSGETTVITSANPDASAGLEPRSGGMTVNGVPLTAPQALLVDGTSFVPIQPLAEAFGYTVEWHAGPRVLTVDSPRPEPEPEEVAADTAAGNTISGDGPPLNAFRVGAHDGYTRVALDLDRVETFRSSLSGNTFTVSFDAGSVPEVAWRQTDRYVQSAYYSVIDGKPNLVVNTHHELSADGSGYRFGTTDSGTFYIDFGPGLSGKEVTDLDAAGLAAARDEQPLPGTDSTLNVTEAVSAPGSNGKRIVVIDPGHGGRDPGAVSYAVEEEVVLQVSLKLRQLLESEGIEVILTRDGDYDLDSNKATDLRLRSNFATADRNMFVSIHANSASNPAAHGIETYIFGEPLSQANLDRAIEENGGQALTDEALAIATDPATMILRETQLNYSRSLATAVQRHLVNGTGAADRGVKQNSYYVISNARTPSILVEIGFVSSPDEGARLNSGSYQDTLARGIYNGVMEFMNNGR